ncbi:hypothetical protein LUZ60_008313 [Juncus effusus]|nr:hypothetical protein LUZ60_008313 [Juncus effusus]
MPPPQFQKICLCTHSTKYLYICTHCIVLYNLFNSKYILITQNSTMFFSNQCIYLIPLFLLLLVPVSLTMEDSSLSVQHEKWMAQHGRIYKNPEEKARRFEIFKTNAEYVQSVNRAGNRTYWLGLNRFADLTNEEFKSSFLGFKPNPFIAKEDSKKPLKYANLANVPSSMDWRDYGAVTAVKDQGTCGDCWAFSAVGAIEGAVKLSTGQLMSLSEQEILDCTGSEMSCKGGTIKAAFHFVMSNGGLTTESNYPYRQKKGSCNAGMKANSVAHISGFEFVPHNNGEALLNAVSMQPVSAGIEGSGHDFQFYNSGIFTGSCGTILDHAVTIIGYGMSGNLKYWLVKNSWGKGWGENGFMRIQRGINSPGGLCGIAMQASYPIA